MVKRQIEQNELSSILQIVGTYKMQFFKNVSQFKFYRQGLFKKVDPC